MKLKTDRVRDALEHADLYYGAYHAADTFGGPSVYFHRRALDTRHAPASSQHLEYVYATLASWGMHRMGAGGSKMCAFPQFSASVEGLKDKILQAQTFTPAAMSERAWSVLKEIFTGLTVMASKTLLVGNSKVMHHMRPNIVPPIDREYTLRYLCGNTMFANDPEKEWRTMRDLISGFFIPVATDKAFAAKAEQWITQNRPWDTSVMKVIDNLLIGARKPAAV
jgi:hypothetical protein